jgi:hypothetical protein
MPLSIEEVKEIERKKGEEKDKVIEFFKKQEKEDGATDFFNSQQVSQRIDISVKSATDILKDMNAKTLVWPIEFINKGQTTTMRLWKIEEKGTFYYGATFYERNRKK